MSELIRPDFFVSYNKADRAWAEWIAWELEEAGYSTVLQAWDFRPGQNYALKMQQATGEADRTVAVLSPDYLTSLYTQPEWASAFAADPTGHTGKLVPVRVRECVLQGLLSQIIYIDLAGLTEEEAQKALMAGVQAGRAKPPERPRFPGSSHSLRPRPSFPGEATQTDLPAVPAEPLSRSRRQTFRLWSILGAGVLVAAILGFLLAFDLEKLRQWFSLGATPQIHSLAVLPLVNLSGDPEQAYFADGMTDALIAELVKISALKVVSRTSVTRYKGTMKLLPEIGRELHADTVLEGSVLQEGDQVRIAVQLVQADTDRQLWAENYRRDLRDILALQSEVASSIAHAIRVELTPQERATFAGKRPVNPAAYRLWLKGNFYASEIIAGNRSMEALDLYRQALSIDPGYASAYVGKAWVDILRGQWWKTLPREEAYREAKAAASTALALEPDLGDAHMVMGYIKFYFEWDWAGAEASFQKGSTLNPTFPVAFLGYAKYLDSMQRPDEAIALGKEYLDLDPLSVLAYGVLFESRLAVRRYDEGIEWLREGLRLYPNYPGYWAGIAATYSITGRCREALPLLDKVPVQFFDWWWANFNARCGRRAEIEVFLKTAEDRWKREQVDAFWVANVYSILRDKDRAMFWLERAYAKRDPYLVMLPYWQDSDPLRSDPRFQKFLRRMNFPKTSSVHRRPSSGWNPRG